MAKQDPAVDVESVNYFLAQARWVAFWGNQQISIPSFANFLGLSGELKKAKTAAIPFKFQIRQSAARKIHLLSGPHYHTVIEAYYKLHPWK